MVDLAIVPVPLHCIFQVGCPWLLEIGGGLEYTTQNQALQLGAGVHNAKVEECTTPRIGSRNTK